MLPGAIMGLALSFPYLQIDSPFSFTTPIFYSHPPKNELFLTRPASRASFSTCSLTPDLTRVTVTVFLPIICSFTVTILAKMQQSWSRKWLSFIFLQLTARKMSSSSLTVIFILQHPEGVGRMIILTLVMSQRGILLSPISTEFSLNYSQFYIQMLFPFFEGISTSYLYLLSFFSECFYLRRTDARAAFRVYFAWFDSAEVNPNGLFSYYLKGIFYSFICGDLRCGCTGTDQSSEELLPNSFFLLISASCRRASLSVLYFSLYCLKSASGQGEFLDESVLDPSTLILALISKGCFFTAGPSSSELVSLPKSFFICSCASRFLASRSARQSCRCFLKSVFFSLTVTSIYSKLKPLFSSIYWIQLQCPTQYNYIMVNLV